MKKTESKKNQISNYFKKIIEHLRQFSKPAFRLERINSEDCTASIYCRSARVLINQKIYEMVCNANIIHNMSSIHSSYLGYFYGLLIDKQKNDISFLLNKKQKSEFFLSLNRGKNIILSITRDGRINYKNKNLDEIYTKYPIDIYRNESVLINFESSQACYIGILAGISQKKCQRHPPKLKLVSSKTTVAAKQVY